MQQSVKPLARIAHWTAWIVIAAGPAMAGEKDPPPDLRAVAQASMVALETGLSLFEIDYGYYMSLETLNDIDFSPTTPQYDYVFNAPGLRVIFPWKGLFETTPLSVLPSPPYNGPYVNFQPGTTQVGTTPYDEGSPLDPWNRPYLLYSPLGLVRGDTGAVTTEYHGDIFDRWVIASLGPDGIVSSDDIFRFFGSGVSAYALSSVSGQGVYVTHLPTGTTYRPHSMGTMTIHGYNLGATQGGSQVLFNGSPLPGSVVSWSATEVVFALAGVVSGPGNLTLAIGPSGSQGITNPLLLHIRDNDSTDWSLYE